MKIKKQVTQKPPENNLLTRRVEGKYSWIAIIVACLIGTGIFSYAAFFMEREKSMEKEKMAVINGVVSGESTSEDYSYVNEGPPVNMAPEEKAQAELRDKKRLEDIKRLQVALSAYYKDKKEYPGELTDLLPKYIEAIPGNPNPGGINYSYTPIGSEPYTFYDLAYQLEVGIEGVESGWHDATPNGIAQP